MKSSAMGDLLSLIIYDHEAVRSLKVTLLVGSILERSRNKEAVCFISRYLLPSCVGALIITHGLIDPIQLLDAATA